MALGNHDGLIQGNQAALAPLERVATGCLKITGLPPLMRSAATRDATGAIARRGLVDGLPPFDKALRSLDRPRTSAAAPALPGTALVPPDERRRYVNTQQYKAVFQGGAQADGHGFDLVDPSENRASNNSAAYYSFSPKPGLRFISVDSVSEGGVTPVSSEGNVDDPQFRWITGELEEATARNELIVIFAHHSIESQRANVLDEAGGPCTANDAHGHDVNPGCDRDPRSSLPIHLGEDFKDLLLRFPKVVAFVAGHSHENKVQSYKSADGNSGFWEIKSPAVADWPTQSRLIEVMDNKDGTLSIFGTLLDFAAPAENPPSGMSAASFSPAQLAAVGRTITYNDPQVGPGTPAAPGPEGRRSDRNVELLIGDPRATAATTVPTTQPNDTGAPAPDDGDDPNNGNDGNEGSNPSGESTGTTGGGDLPFTGLPLLALAVLGLLLALGGGLARRRAR